MDTLYELMTPLGDCGGSHTSAILVLLTLVTLTFRGLVDAIM